MFTLLKTEQQTKARRGVIRTAHGEIQTPFFMPVGTNGTLKSLTFEDVRSINAQLVLANTYHLYLRPGMEITRAAGGLHKFIGWDRPMLTDSGGYQVFSLTKLRKITDDGVLFRSHLDGSRHLFTPEKVIEIEQTLGADMIMPLDECAPYPCGRSEAMASVRRTTAWARRSKHYFDSHQQNTPNQSLFAIIQGATYQDLREQSTQELLEIGFDGYAIGGVSVGEPVEEMFKTLDWVLPHLPSDRPRYFMGIGLPDQIVRAVGEGVDMFDTVLPTRLGRHATAFTRRGRRIMRNAEFAKEWGPIDPQCSCVVCKNYSCSYIRHLCKLNEISGLKLITYHNVHFYISLMQEIRQAIDEDRYDAFQRQFLKEYIERGSGASQKNR